ncbi:outer membrane protein assembly factor BamD [Stenotrophomonas sp. W1S232]|jgi:outer membrane protein assembly factor BamD|uniref:Outer membrane protein assembly factor BamD n=1 Tax=Stenotrophomonas koreensis TaxID=266128 RepID=A0A0R0C2U8_9GAMM|nr:outer membrane protein assembly factor BamD [Stenotrophomonas koreensis]KRG60746.1 competence protein [Stenotrophomonas koreensis]MBB1117740.1 outer membrane protein assembly factor BamD [Stenotrophomonas koreensis]
MIRRSSLLSSSARLATLLLVGALALSGCSRGTKEDAPEGTPVQTLYQDSLKLLEAGNWSGAENGYRRLLAQFPYGPYTEQALIETAYAQYKAGKHDDAVSTIDRFIRTYPTHRNIAYLYYLRGLANANRDTVFLRRVWSLDSSRRDLSAPRQAFADFGIVVDRYPNSRYAADARERMGALRNTFALGELNSGLYYLRRGAWTSAAGRANFVLETYPDTAYQADAIALLAASYEGMGNQALASSARSQLASVNAQHPYLSGDWPNYSWMIRKLNPFAGEKSPLTGESNATINRD